MTRPKTGPAQPLTARAAVVLEEPLDYTGYSDSARANIQMTRLAGGPTVSLEEARRPENEPAKRLLAGRKLSLIVHLDQTIVHATIDPTVGESRTPVTYYIKPRPGLMHFLDKISEKYEMHVYTMGTRAYAERVCPATDPVW
ncbi:HAD-like protein [Exidia glandulosa HHB12029]|uniref:protein-serine/threonine phosphatase n=1 Tax=Exidia glandulosa HHB12029 TaxID=1314781 RepID=A0A166BJP5_EXIGL|nr:HAD-like protein [Exidia glandulosa HHB12029]